MFELEAAPAMLSQASAVHVSCAAQVDRSMMLLYPAWPREANNMGCSGARRRQSTRLVHPVDSSNLRFHMTQPVILIK